VCLDKFGSVTYTHPVPIHGPDDLYHEASPHCVPPNAKARDRGLAARFLRQDARRLGELGESFDTVLDCGLFHIFGAGRPSDLCG
jgi:hypothetical protein